MNITKYEIFLNEGFFEDFRTQYSKLFNGVDQDMYRDFGEYMKKIENENNSNNLARIYNQFLTANQTTFNRKVETLESIDQINKLINDDIKIIYFAIRPVILKVNKDTFTIDTIFGNSGIKQIMAIPEKEFANKISTDVNQNIVNDIMAKSGIKQQTQQPQQPQQPQQSVAEHLSVLMKILEADGQQPATTAPQQPQQPQQNTKPQTTQQPQQNTQNQEKEQVDNVKKYKVATKNWFNGFYKMIFDSSRELMTQATKEAPTNSSIEDVAKMMKSSNNILAKTQLLNKISTLDKNQLQQLGKTLGLNFEEIGNF